MTAAFGPSRDELAERLSLAGIGTSVHFIPLHHMPRYRDAAVYSAAGLPGADAVFPQLLSLPLHQGLTDDEVDLVARSISHPHSRSLLEEVRR